VDRAHCGHAQDGLHRYRRAVPGNARRAQTGGGRKTNLIIPHEPIFYDHLDQTTDLESSPVYQAKAALIQKNSLAVLFSRLLAPHAAGRQYEKGWSRRSAGRSIRKTGSSPCHQRRRVNWTDQSGGSPQQMRLLVSDHVDALVIGETREWETVEYARDAVAQGREKSLIILGHAASEEGGLESCARWIRNAREGGSSEVSAGG
jgi:hypothetical protein